MAMGISDVLGIPLVIVASEPSNPLVNVCPQQTLTSTALFLSYISSGPGHYNAVSQVSTTCSNSGMS